MALPTPRDLLTSLITSLSAPAPRDPSASNPLRDAGPEKAALLSALHVLFPSLLLPALDLLDRGLVTRVLRADPDTSRHGEAQRGLEGPRAEEDEGDGVGAKAGGAEAREDVADPGGLHVVRSLASAKKRGDGSYHLVFLGAWTCTCPSFTLSALPPEISTAHTRTETRETGTATGGGGAGAEEWSFGGLSADVEGLPCCKHLLACVLAEQWGALEGYVPVRRVGRGEMAGLVADV